MKGKGSVPQRELKGACWSQLGETGVHPGRLGPCRPSSLQSTWGAWASDWGLPVVCSLLSFLGAGIPEIRVGETQVRVGETLLKEVNPDEAGETEGGGSLGNGRRA